MSADFIQFCCIAGAGLGLAGVIGFTFLATDMTLSMTWRILASTVIAGMAVWIVGCLVVGSLTEELQHLESEANRAAISTDSGPDR